MILNMVELRNRTGLVRWYPAEPTLEMPCSSPKSETRAVDRLSMAGFPLLENSGNFNIVHIAERENGSNDGGVEWSKEDETL